MLFVAVRVYVVVPLGLTVVEPVDIGETAPTPWSIARDVARFVAQKSVVAAPELIENGTALKDTIIGVELLDPAQVVPEGVMVYTVDPVDWERRVLSEPDKQDIIAVPPKLLEATVRS